MDFLEEKEAEEVAAEPVEQAAPAEEPEAPKGEQPLAEPPQAEPEPSAPPAPEPEATRVPITAMLDEREKRQAAERELQELRRWKEQIEAQARQSQQKPPDIYEDPEGFVRQTQATVQQALWNERLNMSEALARDKFGDETVETATRAFEHAVKSNPSIYAEMRQHPNPYSFVVNWHKRQSILSEIGTDPDKWREQERERIRQELLAQASQPSPKPAAPPPSLSKAPARGNDAIVPGNAFDSMFPG
jgi:hypothetical protein